VAHGQPLGRADQGPAGNRLACGVMDAGAGERGVWLLDRKVPLPLASRSLTLRISLL
jgi:hypothetical protein